MSMDITIFNNPNFGDIRTSLSEQGEPLFCLADVCKALDIKNPRDCKTRLNPKGVYLIDLQLVGNTDGVIINELGNTKANFVTEGNLYKCIFQSHKPEAEAFQDWVTDEVLPSIRKNGAYMTPLTIESIISNPEYGIKLLGALKEERAAKEKALLQARQAGELAESRQLTIDAQCEVMNRQASKIEADRPRVQLAQDFLEADDCIPMGHVANVLASHGVCNATGKPIGRTTLFVWLRAIGVLKSDGTNTPYQNHVDLGRFKVVYKPVRMGGKTVNKAVTLATPKGIEYLLTLVPANHRLPALKSRA